MGQRQDRRACSTAGTGRRRPVAARSAFMRSEEIDREREQSGWNQYAGEEEDFYGGESMSRGNGSGGWGMGYRNENYNQERNDGEGMIRRGMERDDRETGWEDGQTAVAQRPGQMQNNLTGGEQMPDTMPVQNGDMGMPGGMRQSNRMGTADNMQENGDMGMSGGMRQPNRMGMADNMQENGSMEMSGGMRQSNRMGMADNMQMSGDMNMPGTMQGQPYFRMPDYAQVLEEQQQRERDLRKMQSMYPGAAKILLPYIEEECDKMEYEGSAMFDEYPDQTTVQRIQQSVVEQVRDQFPEREQEAPDDMLSMQYQGNRNRPGRNWLEDLTRVLLLQEMHHRRCRHRECRRRF